MKFGYARDVSLKNVRSEGFDQLISAEYISGLSAEDVISLRGSETASTGGEFSKGVPHGLPGNQEDKWAIRDAVRQKYEAGES